MRGAAMYDLRISIHALRGEGDLVVLPCRFSSFRISIHALRGEGDEAQPAEPATPETFLSTPSVGRATCRAGGV